MPSDHDNLPQDNKPRKKHSIRVPKNQDPPISPEINELRMSFDFNVNGNSQKIAADDLITLCELGRGAYGVVEKVKHSKTNTIMAVKRITATQNSTETKMLLMDLQTLRRSDCPYIVDFYGAMFRQGDVMICMEVMDISLDKLYRRVAKANQLMPEDVLWTIAFSVLSALKYLHQVLRIIHRDVKPSNMLIDRSGKVKLCDFGISGILRPGSFANTVEVGCKFYMAPERINQETKKKYSSKSDTWSFGISMIEISICQFPYEMPTNLFKQQMQVLNEPAPSLPNDGRFSPSYRSFVHRAVEKKVDGRPRPHELLEDPFVKEYRNCENNVSSFVSNILETNLED